jgi:hypothetical protein
MQEVGDVEKLFNLVAVQFENHTHFLSLNEWLKLSYLKNYCCLLPELQ